MHLMGDPFRAPSPQGDCCAGELPRASEPGYRELRRAQRGACEADSARRSRSLLKGMPLAALEPQMLGAPQGGAKTWSAPRRPTPGRHTCPEEQGPRATHPRRLCCALGGPAAGAFECHAQRGSEERSPGMARTCTV